MGAPRGLDDIVSYLADPADAAAMVPNSARKARDRRITEARAELGALKAALGDAVLDEPKNGGRSAHGLKIAQGGKVKKLRELSGRIEALVAERKPLPKRISIAEAGIGRQVMRRRPKPSWTESRSVPTTPRSGCSTTWSSTTRTSTTFAICSGPSPSCSGTIYTTAAGVVVSLDPPDTPVHRHALRGLVGDLNASGATFPGTDVAVTYRVRMHHSELAALGRMSRSLNSTECPSPGRPKRCTVRSAGGKIARPGRTDRRHSVINVTFHPGPVPR